MRLSTKGRYAVTAMIDLALHNDMGPVALTDIADTQKISVSYLEQLFARLRKNGLRRLSPSPPCRRDHGGGDHHGRR
jgi:Rrf2 family iron-sulfur cluster assembly transcriptional regulator